MCRRHIRSDGPARCTAGDQSDYPRSAVNDLMVRVGIINNTLDGPPTELPDCDAVSQPPSGRDPLRSFGLPDSRHAGLPQFDI